MAFEYHFPKRSASSIEHWGAFATTIEIIAIERNDAAALPRSEQVISAVNDENGFDSGAVTAILGRQPIVAGAAADAFTGSNNGAAAYLTLAYVRSVDVEPLPDARGYSIRINVTNYDYGEDPLIRVNVQATAAQQAIYRTKPEHFGKATENSPVYCDEGITDSEWYSSSKLKPACTASGSSGDENEQKFERAAGDIGGKAVDVNGVPMNTLRPRLQYDVQVMARGPYIVPTTAGTDVVADSALTGNSEYFRYEIGKRNEYEFLGCECGTLLFTGVTRTRLDGEWSQMTLSFLWDEWRHAEQIPRRPYNTGNIGLMRRSIECDNSAPDPRNIVHQFAVYWQPMFDVADFSQLFSTTLTNYLNDAGYTIGEPPNTP